MFLSLWKLWWNLGYFILMNLLENYSEILNRLAFLSLRNIGIKMIKTVHRNLTGVSNMADQGRIILQTIVSATFIKCDWLESRHVHWHG